MFVRKAFLYWQFAAVIVLPLWLVVGWPIFGAGGWKVLGVFLGAVVLGFGLATVAGLIYARKDVRVTRAVSWPDVGVLALWHALIIAVGFYAESAPLLSIAVIIVGAGAFWLAVWELYTAARRRVRAVMTEIELASQPGYLEARRAGESGRAFRSAGATRDPSVVVITEKPTQD